MRIVVNDIAASKGGAMTVLRDFYTCVCQNDHENDWVFLLNDRYFPETGNVKILTLPEIKYSRWKKLLFEFVTGKRFIEALAPDVVFSLQNIITFGLKVPQAVYIHQSIPFQSVKRFSFFRASEKKLAVIQYLIGGIIKLSARKSDLVIVQTKWMKDAVCRMCHLPQGKVYTSLPVVNGIHNNQGEVAFGPERFFYPTAEEIYKNNECIYSASKMLEENGIGHQVTLTLAPERSQGSCVCVGRLPYEDVLTRYRECTLVFPSYIETFGYPLAEARSLGGIVLAADTPFAREVLAGYNNAYFFDPFRPGELAELMERIVTGEIKKQMNSVVPAEKHVGWTRVMEWILRMKR